MLWQLKHTRLIYVVQYMQKTVITLFCDYIVNIFIVNISELQEKFWPISRDRGEIWCNKCNELYFKAIIAK